MLSPLKYFFTPILALYFAATVQAQTLDPKATTLPEVGFAIIKTSQVAVMQALLVPGGSITEQVDSNFSAFLIKHNNDYLLFDTGMGRQIEGQYQQGMPPWWRPFFTHKSVS